MTLLRIPFTFALAAAMLITARDAIASSFSFEDVERFAQVFTQERQVSATEIENAYIVPSSVGLNVLKGRIGSSENLANTINTHPDIYGRALEVCLPALHNLEDDVIQAVASVTSLVNDSVNVPVVVTIGNNNTAATVSPNGIVLALEVICQQAQNTEQAKALLVEYVTHESVHILQYKYSKRTSLDFTLLEMALIEGSADFIANLASGHVGALQRDRDAYGSLHEQTLWAAFQPVMHTKKYGPWLYTKAANGQPADMGYWIGKQIAKRYYANQEDNVQAIITLLSLQDAEETLRQSGYSPNL